MKNPNGYGSVDKLTGKHRRNPWAVRITTSLENGTQRREYIGYYKTKREAQEALAKYHSEPISTNRNSTFAELYYEWSDMYFNKVSRASVDNYRAAFKLLEPLHKQKFLQIRTAHMQKVIDSLADEKSRSTLTKVKLLCNQMYNYALENDIVQKNYAQFIRFEKTSKREKEIFSDDDIRTLEANIDVGCADMIIVLIYTGLRIQELLNLRKCDIDFSSGVITGGLKTDAGRNRVVPIHSKIKSILLGYCNNTVIDTDYIFRNKEGHQLSQDYFRRHMYYKTLEELGIARKTPHCTRHTCASLLVRAGADIKAIEMILGHTDYAFTADTYVHVDTEFLIENLTKI